MSHQTALDFLVDRALLHNLCKQAIQHPQLLSRQLFLRIYRMIRQTSGNGSYHGAEGHRIHGAKEKSSQQPMDA